jgi:epoxyqueuosine reductase QueG
VLDPPAELWHNPARGRIARYAWGVDYHEVMLPRLRTLSSLGFLSLPGRDFGGPGTGIR